MRMRKVGPVAVSAIGLGAMPMSIEGRPDEDRSISTIHAALDTGVLLIDTADTYQLFLDEVGHNEMLVARALKSYGKSLDVLIATKGGHIYSPDGPWAINGSPRYIKRACDASLGRLRVDAVGLYHLHRPDPRVPYEDSIGALRELLDEGKIISAGISNVNSAQIRLAADILGTDLVSVQNELSPASRSSEAELELCTKLGISFLPWSPFGGIAKARALASWFPRFGEVASARGVTPHQMVLAWLLAKSPVVIPIPGASRPETILDSAKAAELDLSAAEFIFLDCRRQQYSTNPEASLLGQGRAQYDHHLSQCNCIAGPEL